MSWELILQLAALALLLGIVTIIGSAMWMFISGEKHKRSLELIDRRNRAMQADMQWRDNLGRAEDG